MVHLVVTTRSDTSVDYFRPLAEVIFVDEGDVGPLSEGYDTLYIRSHFSRPETMPQRFEGIIDSLGRGLTSRGVRPIDSMSSVAHILDFEDKWRQYNIFKDLMPETALGSKSASMNGPKIYKRRLSSRGSGIVWSEGDMSDSASDWIVQPVLNILEELRVYIIKGVAFPKVAVRQSKTREDRVLVKNIRDISDDELGFSMAVYNKMPSLDFIGLDVALTDTGPVLIEVNRSPDFSTFSELCGENLAGVLYGGVALGGFSR